MTEQGTATGRRLERSPALDGVRGVAVLLVLANHGGALVAGWAGVDVFFVLSGFLITALLCEEWDRSGRIDLRAFYERRARRLLPGLALLLTGYTVAVVWFGMPTDGWSLRHQLATTLLFANNWLAATGAWGAGSLGSTWTLAQEEQFYLLWPVALVGLWRLRLRPGAILWLLAGLYFTLTVVLPHTPLDALVGDSNGYFNPFLRACELLLGCAAALAWRYRLLPRELRSRTALWLTVLFICAGVPRLYAEVPTWGKMLSFSLPTALLLTLLMEYPNSLPSRCLSWTPLRRIGRISYGMYLYQGPLTTLLALALPGAAWYVRTPVLVVAATLAASASWCLVESRFVRRPSGQARAEGVPALPVQAGPIPSGPPPRTGPCRTDVRTLPAALNAQRVLSRGQFAVALGGCAAGAAVVLAHLVTGTGPRALDWVRWSLCVILALDVLVVAGQTLFVLGAWRAPVLRPDPRAVPDRRLPSYSILVPLYQEHRVLPDLVRHLAAMDYPPDRLQILLLIEEDDWLTRHALAGVTLDARFEVLYFAAELPRTKPKACLRGLHHVTGEFCVIYDAEDRPDPDQLRKAAAAFRGLPEEVVCVQAELTYWNPWTNWLTECFAAEYALRYGLVLRGMDRFRLPIPLGGTSNHFRTAALCELGAWDPYNVTEDADLGMRLARRGWSTRMMTSTTYEEANSHLGNWVRQRSRWTKGHIQTWFVHMRRPVRLWRELGTAGFAAFHLALGLGPLVMLLNPVLMAVTAAAVLQRGGWGPELFPAAVREWSLACLVVGNLLLVGQFAAACAAQGLRRAIPTMLTMPAYWVLMSVAAYKAVLQLLRPGRRHYWELTRHGLVDATPAVPAQPVPHSEPVHR